MYILFCCILCLSHTLFTLYPCVSTFISVCFESPFPCATNSAHVCTFRVVCTFCASIKRRAPRISRQLRLDIPSNRPFSLLRTNCRKFQAPGSRTFREDVVIEVVCRILSSAPIFFTIFSTLQNN